MRSSAVHDAWSEDALLQGLLAREAGALEALIAQYSREIAYFVRVVLDGVGTAQDVEECVNDLFIAVWEDIAAFDPQRGSLRTWLTMRAKYVGLDRRRYIQRRQAYLSPASESARLGEGEVNVVGLAGGAQSSAQDSLENILEARERQAEVRLALEHLPELDRSLVYLRYFRLASSDEISSKTGLTRRAIDTRLWRARRHLRQVLAALEERVHGHVGAI